MSQTKLLLGCFYKILFFRIIAGITEDTTSNHIVRATLEAVCFQVRDILDAMCKDCKTPLKRLKVCEIHEY